MLQGVEALPTIERFSDLCTQTGGNVTAIALALAVTRQTVSRWIREKSDFSEALEDARESALDIAEDRAMMLISGIPIKNETGEIVAWQERPDAGLIKFKLATQGRGRGYAEITEMRVTKKSRTVVRPEADGSIIIEEQDEPEEA